MNSASSDRAALGDLLDDHGIESVAAVTGVAALAAVRQQRLAVILIDVELEDITGYELCGRLREEHGERISIIFTSARRTSKLDRVAGLLIGADDYIAEPFEPDELVARVRRCLARSHGPSAALAEAPHEQPAGDLRPPSSGLPLTKREREVLGMLAAGMTQNEIADTLVISPKTVATHIQRMLIKLEVHSRTQAVAVAYRDGLL